MATILIKPVQARTAGGHPAEITGIDITSDTDQLEGAVTVNAGRPREVIWDLAGTCRDNHPDFNIDPAAPGVSGVVETVKRLQDK